MPSSRARRCKRSWLPKDTATPMTPQQYEVFAAEERRRYAPIIKAAGAAARLRISERAIRTRVKGP